MEYKVSKVILELMDCKATRVSKELRVLLEQTVFKVLRV